MDVLFFDIDTQNDFIEPSGALYVPGAETLKPVYQKISVFAKERGITVLASADAHPKDDPEFVQFPPHCVAGSRGQQKIPETLPELFYVLPNDGQPVDDADLAHRCVQFEKQTFNVFSNPKAELFLQKLQPKQVIVYGVATDYCVKAAVEGLLERQFPVILLTDAIKAVQPENEESILQDLSARGVQLATTDILASL